MKERYEGGLALLKYKKEFNARCRKDGETLHSYLSSLRLSYKRAYSPPKVAPLPAEANANQKEEHARQEGALVFYNKRRDEDILCQFVNRLGRELREDVRPSLENKLDEILKNQRTLQAAAVKKGGKRFAGRQRPGPKPSDICRACNGRGHWARSCPSLNEGGVGRRPPV